MQRTLILLAVVMFLTVACGAKESADANLLPTAAPVPSLNGVGESPRSDATSGRDLIPPTYTPSAVLLTAAAGIVVQGTAQSQPPIDPGNLLTYTIQPGDTLGEIATAFDVELAAIADLNNIANIDVIEVGEILLLPIERPVEEATAIP